MTRGDHWVKPVWKVVRGECQRRCGGPSGHCSVSGRGEPPPASRFLIAESYGYPTGSAPPAPGYRHYVLLQRVTQGVTRPGALEPGEDRPVMESRRYYERPGEGLVLRWLTACPPGKGLEVVSGPRGVSSPCAWDGHQTGLLPCTCPDRASEGRQHAIALGSRPPSIPSAPAVC